MRKIYGSEKSQQKKRNVTAEQLTKIQNILDQMLYSHSETDYMAQYDLLAAMDCKDNVRLVLD